MDWKRRGLAVLKWVVTAFVAIVFVMMGTGKIVGQEPWARYFTAWGYADWFRVLIGLVQAGAGVALLVPRLSAYAAAALGSVMVGAVVTELTHDTGFGARTPTVYVAVLAIIALAHRSRAVRLWGESAGV